MFELYIERSIGGDGGKVLRNVREHLCALVCFISPGLDRMLK